jgi:hypothetical protein
LSHRRSQLGDLLRPLLNPLLLRELVAVSG